MTGCGNCIASGVGGQLADSDWPAQNHRALDVLRRRGRHDAAVAGASSFWAIVLLTALVGVASEFYRPASSALLADLVPESQRVTAYSAYRLAFNAGWAFGPATAGFLAGRSFFWLFAGDAATSVLFGLVAWFALPEGDGAPKNRKLAGCLRSRCCAATGRILRVIGASLAIGIVFLQMGTTFSLNVTGQGFSAATYGALISCNGIMIVLCELPLTTITQRFPPRRVMAVGYLLIGCGFAFERHCHHDSDARRW